MSNDESSSGGSSEEMGSRIRHKPNFSRCINREKFGFVLFSLPNRRVPVGSAQPAVADDSPTAPRASRPKKGFGKYASQLSAAASRSGIILDVGKAIRDSSPKAKPVS